MGVSIATYRSRIGRFNTSEFLSYIPETIDQSYKSKLSLIPNLRIAVLCIILLNSTVSETNDHPNPLPQGEKSLTTLPLVLNLRSLDLPIVPAAALH